jgi:peptidyl-prolyl cis-trans isomerase B (cyclophilin B)
MSESGLKADQFRKQSGIIVNACLVACAMLFSLTAVGQELVAVIDTSKGEIRAELNAQAAPTTVANFVNLAQRGFYDRLTLHR